MADSSRGITKRKKPLRFVPPPRFVPPEILICFDPGSDCGYSVFIKEILVACGYGKHAKFLSEPVWEGDLKGGVFLVERPKSYPGKRRLVNPNSLMQTEFRAAELTQLYRMQGMVCEEVSPPSVWKGNLEHDLVEERMFECLLPEERSLIYQAKSARSKKLDHNMVDAVSIGLWRLRRWRQRERLVWISRHT